MTARIHPNRHLLTRKQGNRPIHTITVKKAEKSRAHKRAIKAADCPKAAYRKSWTVENICMKLKLSGFRMETDMLPVISLI